MKRPHREVIGAAVMDSKLLCKVIRGKESVGRIETFLVLSVAALHLAVAAGRIRPNELMMNP